MPKKSGQRGSQMLANRAKVLAKLKSYQKDLFAFNFKRAFLARTENPKSVFVPSIFYNEWSYMNFYNLFEYLEKTQNKESRQQIGTLFAGYLEYVKLHENQVTEFYLSTGIIFASHRPNLRFLTNIISLGAFLKKNFNIEDGQVQDYAKIMLHNNSGYIYGNITINDFSDMCDIKNFELGYKILLDCQNVNADNWNKFYRTYQHDVPRLCKLHPDDWTLNPRYVGNIICTMIDNLVYKFGRTFYDSSITLPDAIQLAREKIFLLFMFDNFFKTGEKTFDLYDMSLSKKHYSVAEMKKMPSEKLKFDETKTMCEILTNICSFLGPKVSSYFLLRIRLKNFVESCYDPLSFCGTPKI